MLEANGRNGAGWKAKGLFRPMSLALVMGLALGANATEIELSKVVEKVKVSGDLRMRQELFKKGTKGQTDRSRQRFRLRVGAELPFPNAVTAKIRFASGTGEQVSTNQSFDNLSAQKEFWIDRAFLEWGPLSFLKLSGGQMANPLWTVYSSDIVWDDDFNPEGFGEQLKFSLFGRGRFFLNALQMVSDEDAGVNNDQWTLSQQLGFEVPLSTLR